MKYRKKPVEIEAIQWTGDNKNEIADFVGESAMFYKVKYLQDENPNYWRLEINTLEGVMKADHGDYVIKGVKGEFYPCKPDVFEQTYDKC